MAAAKKPTAPVVVQQSAPDPGAGSLDSDIASFIAENPGAENGEVELEPGAEPPAETEEEAEDEGAKGEPNADDASADDSASADSSTEEGEAPATGSPGAVDVAALKKAIDADDPAAFVAALGKKAETLLTGKAHKALRLQVKEAANATAKAVRAQAKADELAKRLSDKYGDPIAARKAAEGGDVDSFISLVEHWSGHSWNDTLRWATAGMAGRKERLEAKARATNEEAQRTLARQQQAQAEVRDWCDKGVKKLAPELHSEDVVNMVVSEIRAGFATGVTTPAKALPLVKKKLEANYKALHKVFGKSAKPAARQTSRTPASVPARAENGKYRDTSLEEDIASFKRENGLR